MSTYQESRLPDETVSRIIREMAIIMNKNSMLRSILFILISANTADKEASLLKAMIPWSIENTRQLAEQLTEN
jgi:hypothetical protein